MTGPLSTPFDFGLDTTQEARAERIHADSIIIDLLSQHAGGSIFEHYPPELQRQFASLMASAGEGFEALIDAIYWPYEMSKLGQSILIVEWYRRSGLTCGTYGLSVANSSDHISAKWDATVAKYADLPWLRYVTTAREIRQAKRDGVIAFYAHCQPILPPPQDLGAFDIAYGRGLRSFMLTYNTMNNIGVGCTERVDAGLSRFGVDVIARCNDLGMIVDVSHCGHLTTMDACRHSNKPVNANHSAAKSVFDHARGKSDDALRAIAGTGGVIGVVALPAFLTDRPNATINAMLDHIDYIADLVGWPHVAIGTDWPLQAPDNLVQSVLAPTNKSVGFRDEDRLDVSAKLIGFDDCRDLRNITRGLVKRGYGDEQIRGIMGENALRVFAEVCG